MDYTELTRSELIEELEARGLSVDNLIGSGANGYVKVSDLVDALVEFDTIYDDSYSKSTFESKAEIIEGPPEDVESDDDEPARGVFV